MSGMHHHWKLTKKDDDAPKEKKTRHKASLSLVHIAPASSSLSASSSATTPSPSIPVPVITTLTVPNVPPISTAILPAPSAPTATPHEASWRQAQQPLLSGWNYSPNPQAFSNPQYPIQLGIARGTPLGTGHQRRASIHNVQEYEARRREWNRSHAAASQPPQPQSQESRLLPPVSVLMEEVDKMQLHSSPYSHTFADPPQFHSSFHATPTLPPPSPPAPIPSPRSFNLTSIQEEYQFVPQQEPSRTTKRQSIQVPPLLVENILPHKHSIDQESYSLQGVSISRTTAVIFLHGIVEQLTVPDLAALACTNKFFCKVASSPSLWEHLYLTHWAPPSSSSSSSLPLQPVTTSTTTSPAPSPRTPRTFNSSSPFPSPRTISTGSSPLISPRTISTGSSPLISPRTGSSPVPSPRTISTTTSSASFSSSPVPSPRTISSSVSPFPSPRTISSGSSPMPSPRTTNWSPVPSPRTTSSASYTSSPGPSPRTLSSGSSPIPSPRSGFMFKPVTHTTSPSPPPTMSSPRVLTSPSIDWKLLCYQKWKTQRNICLGKYSHHKVVIQGLPMPPPSTKNYKYSMKPLYPNELSSGGTIKSMRAHQQSLFICSDYVVKELDCNALNTEIGEELRLDIQDTRQLKIGDYLTNLKTGCFTHFDVDDNVMVLSCLDGTIIGIDRQSRMVKWYKTEQNNHVYRLLAADGVIITGGWDGKIILHQSYDGTAVRCMNDQHTSPVHAMEMMCTSTRDQHHHHSGTLLTGGSDKLAKIWDIEAGVVKNTLKAHKKTITQVGSFFMPECRDPTIITASKDGTCKLWAQDGTLINSITIPSGASSDDKDTTVHFVADEIKFITSGGDGVVRCWDPRKLTNTAVLPPKDSAFFGQNSDAVRYSTASLGGAVDSMVACGDALVVAIKSELNVFDWG